MAEENEKPEEAPAEEKKAPEPTGKNPLVTILLILNMLAMSAIAYLQYTFMQKEAAKPTVRDIIKQEMEGENANEASEELVQGVEQKEGKLLSLEGFTVNLAKSDGPRRFVRLNTVLKFSNKSKESEFTSRKPQIRDTIISILNSKRPEDLLKKEGKTYLKEEIKAAINSFLIDGELVDVFTLAFR
jgi:flagellar FliL protein